MADKRKWNKPFWLEKEYFMDRKIRRVEMLTREGDSTSFVLDFQFYEGPSERFEFEIADKSVRFLQTRCFLPGQRPHFNDIKTSDG